jgi:threonine dehydratase
MPETAPSIKVQAVEALGARVVIVPGAYDDAQTEARRRAEAEQLAFVPPFDDPDVIAGQGTVGMEILRQHPGPIAAIFVPVGGGSLVAGIAAYVKALHPEIRVIGVEPEDAAGMTESLRAGERIELAHVGIFADGVAVRRVGEETFRLCRELVDEMILVNTDETCAAIKDIFEDTRGIVEPAGALAVAGLKKYAERTPEREGALIAIASGANLNFDRLRHVAERAELGEGREAVLAVQIPERPGSFLAFCRAIGRRNVTEFNYRFSDPTRACIFVGLELKRAGESAEIVAQLKGAGYPVEDLSQNELAKLHVRHLVGGISSHVSDERLLRFEFPEKPGALLRFLEAIGQRWNISLFHYRNHGSDFGRVLAGVQVPAAERPEFEAHLARLGYPHVDETDNLAYRLFLAPRSADA